MTMKTRVSTIASVVAATSIAVCSVAADTSQYVLEVAIEQKLYFGGVDKPVAPGRYELRQASLDQLKLVSESGEEILVPATFGSHTEEISQPAAVAAEAADNEFHLLLLLPGGTTLDAAASYDGIAARGTRLQRVAISSARVSRLYVGSRTRYQRQLATVAQAARPTRERLPVLQRPDLTITDCDIRFRQNRCIGPLAGFDVDAAVKNIGIASATLESGRRYARWYKGQFAGSYWTKYAPPGGRLLLRGEQVLMPNWMCVGENTPLGQHSWTFEADPDNRISESNENNNVRTCTIEVTADMRPDIPPKADLRVVGIVPKPSVGSTSTLFEFQVTVQNLGSHASEAGVYCTGTGSAAVGALGQNQSASRTLKMSYYMPRGDKTVTCSVRTKGGVEDSNPSNNSMTASFQVQ